MSTNDSGQELNELLDSIQDFDANHLSYIGSEVSPPQRLSERNQTNIQNDQLEPGEQNQSSSNKKISNEDSTRKQTKIRKRKQIQMESSSYSPNSPKQKHQEDRKFENWANKLRPLMNIQLLHGQNLGQCLLRISKQSPVQMKRICKELKNGHYKRELQGTKIKHSSMVGYINQFRKVKKYLPKNINKLLEKNCIHFDIIPIQLGREGSGTQQLINP